MARTAYTDEQKTHALDLYVQHGACEAARRTGIPRNTLSSWAHRAGLQPDAPEQTRAAVEHAQLRNAERRAGVQAKLIDTADRMLDRIREGEVDYRGNVAKRVEFDEASPASCKAFATAAAILIDKYRLEMGEATTITEHAPERNPDHEDELAEVLTLVRDGQT